MKKIILAVIFCTAFILPATFAEDDSVNTHISNTLHLLFNITDGNSFINQNYQQTKFVYNGMQVVAFKNKTSGWVGFFKKLSVEDLPENALLAIKRKYKNYNFQHVMLYLNSNAELCYFAEITSGNKYIVLKIQPSGCVKVFG